ncbi:putative sporulation protein YtxC [Ornithinibacillus sp. L9]|uniref:Putative sporulation protein YtxC n=1 Tax=Ornithinibacillus caprae TaxID=2678566 RepID=A0A6N8FB67_9BACI|nr:putative sporulation protein YtxC [Ornithinibacillus caprae]MUK86892.1 putative sporulation protein YtxC [Ornithinibacillus caprae]
MLDVYFSSNKEVISFCEQLFRYNKKIELHWKTHEDWGNHLQIDDQDTNHETFETVAKSMVDVFKSHRLSPMIKGVIEDFYYYTNADEIERILEITHWIVSGEDDDSLQVRNSKEDPTELLYSLFIANIKNTSPVHFDSIVNFRLKAFKDQIIYFVGLAIDEFKREEDHQEFVNMLREFITKKEPKYNTIHILQGNPFSFFKPNGKRFSKMELRMILQQEPLYIVGLESDELNLAPLVAMAPKKIKIYGDHPSEPKTLTVINVFQERVEFEPVSKFPFPYYLKNQ